jgi:phosphatidate cytidylyltransferase
MQQSLRQRLSYGSLMLGALLALLYFDYSVEKYFHLAGVGLLLLMLFLLPLATREVGQLFVAERVQPYRILAVMGSGLLAIHAFLTQFPRFRPIAASTLAFIIVVTMILAAIRRASARESEQAITRMAGTVLAMLYLGGLAWFLIAIRVKHSEHHGFQGSTQAVVMILLVVKFTDIGAYFGGRSFGKHKLIPWLSPGKTWEGLICGLATAGLVGVLCVLIWPRALSTLNWPKAFLFGVVIGGVGQAGDLLESLMKRDAQVKDSGSLIPGFGGLLDVIDSPLLAAPAAYLLFSLF